jgi:signal transduction histidine kinase
VWQSRMMTGRTLRLTIGVLGTLFAVLGEAISISAGTPPSDALLHLAIGLTYLYGGLAIWAHEPPNNTGRLMAAVGVTWFISTLASSGVGIVSELALAFEDTSTVLLLALVLAYPTGRLERTIDRWAVAILAVGATALNILFSTSLPLIQDKSSGLYGGVVLATMTTVVVIGRWVAAPPRARRDLAPVLIAGLVFLATLISNLVRRIAQVPEDVAPLLVAANDLAPAAIPIALLIGFYRQSERRSTALVAAIPDRMFRYGRDGRYVAGGSPQGRGGGTDGVVPGGERLHSMTFAAAGPAALDAAARALDTGELQAFDYDLDLPAGRRHLEARVAPSGPDEVTAIVRDFTDQRQVEAELRRSRARIVEATDEERRRLERDLHDGAQQRLVSVSLALRLLRGRLARSGQPADVEAADNAAAELKTAIKEVRELARGIHPAILTEAGLGPAMTVLAARSAVPATVSAVPDDRLPAPVEATAYFVISEGLANIAKYSGASEATIGATQTGSVLRVEVADDGQGGADSSRGTGIRGLEDRVAALGGRLTVESPPGRGTVIVAEIPTG